MIDLEDVGGADGERNGALANAGGQNLARLGVELLAVAQSSNRVVDIEDHRGREYRTEQRAPTDFIDSGDTAIATLPRLPLESRVT